MITPLQKAKQKVASIIFALTSTYGHKWTELLRGGFECDSYLVSSRIRGYAGDDGEWLVEIRWGADENPWSKVLASGSYAEHYCNQATPQPKDEEVKRND